MQFKRILFTSLWATAVAFSMTACGGDDDDDNGKEPGDTSLHYCEGGTFKYGVVVIQKADGSQVEVCINNLPVKAVKGAIKKDGTDWDIVDRQGVMFSDILDKAGVTDDDTYPVNLIGGDGFDALRTKIQNTAQLPKLDFMRAYAYIYADDPGSKHPHYPGIGNDGLIVDYDIELDSEVPEYIGNGIASLSMLRMKVLERADSADFGQDEGIYYGIIEINPDFTSSAD